MSLLCEDPLAQGVFGPCDDLLFSGVSLDLEELFNDDALFSGAFLGCGDTLMAPSTAAAMPSACDQLLQPETCSSSDSRAAASRTTSSGGSSGMFRPSWDRPAQELASPAVVQLAVQRCAGPPTRKAPARGPVRMVPAVQQQMQQAAACNNAASQFVAAAGMVAAASAGALLSKPAERLAALLASGDDMSDSDSDASNDTEEGALGHSKKPTNKRKAPEIDWRSITDPSERRRQRRLAKNRMTAARSRERKKVQWADMEAKLANLDNDNKRLKAMLQQLASENSTLRGQLEGMGVVQASAPGRQGKGHSHSTEPAALVFISILLLLCCALPGERAMLLGSAAPILLLAQLLSQTKKANCSSGEPSQQSLAVTLLHFLASIKLLLARASAKLRTSVHNMLYRRHHYVGRRVLRATADWASSSKTWLPKGLAASDRGPLTPVVKEEEVLLVSASPLVKIEPVDTPMFDPCSFLVSSLLN